MMLVTICLICLLGSTGCFEYKGCVKNSMIQDNISCNDTMKRIFIINAYLVNHQGCNITGIVIPLYQHLFETEITNKMRKTCNAKTECYFYNQLTIYNLPQYQEYPLVVTYTCEWLFADTPVVQVLRDRTFSLSGNQFVFHSQDYPNEYAASNAYCNISSHHINPFILITLKDLYPADRNTMDYEYFCIKSSVSSECMKPGTAHYLHSSGSISVHSLQRTGAIPGPIRFYLLIQAAKEGPADQIPTDDHFQLDCIHAYSQEMQTTRSPTQSSVGPPSTFSWQETSAPTNLEAEDVTTSKPELISPRVSTHGAIIGGTLAPVIVIALGILGFLLWRRHRGKWNSFNDKQHIQPEAMASSATSAVEHDYVNAPEKKHSEVSYEPIAHNLFRSPGANGGVPIHPKEITNSSKTLNHVEVNGDMYALPGMISTKKTIKPTKPPIPTKPHLTSKESKTSTPEDDDFVDDVEIVDNAIYHRI